MKKLITISLALAFLGAMALPASAFVFVFADIEKTKDVEVTETITIQKTATIDVDVVLEATKAAESLALVNQENLGNSACENCAEKRGFITNSVTFNTGVTHLNQAVGNMNNQGNVLAASVDTGEEPTAPGDDLGFANSEASMSQNQGFIWDKPDQLPGPELIFEPNIINSENILYREADISNSVNWNTGITGVNQGSGQAANQANSVSLAVSLAGGVALSEADLGQHTICGNAVYETNTYKNVAITDSVNNNMGVTHVNQSAGNMANQGNNVSVAVAYTPAP
jgi:hypothetical protein